MHRNMIKRRETNFAGVLNKGRHSYKSSIFDMTISGTDSRTQVHYEKLTSILYYLVRFIEKGKSLTILN